MRRIRPWIAALLALLSAGLGHFYARRTRRAIVWAAVWLTLIALTNVLLHLLEETAWLALIPAYVIAFVGHAIDAYAAAPRRAARAGWPRLLVYLAFPATVFAANHLARETAPLRTYYASASAMAPTLIPRDRVFARVRSPFCRSLSVDRGDIVLTTREGRRGSAPLVSRVVGLPNDHVRVDEAGLSVNGERITGEVLGEAPGAAGRAAFLYADERFPDTRPWTVYGAEDRGWGPPYDGVVPEGHVFLLGDNRTQSRDSRAVGPAPMGAIHGVVLRAPFSLAREPRGFWRQLRVDDAGVCAPQ